MKKIIVLSLSMLMLLLSSYFITETYAKFRKTSVGNSTIEIASWNIKVNNESILNKTLLEGNITPIFSGNEYTKANVILLDTMILL